MASSTRSPRSWTDFSEGASDACPTTFDEGQAMLALLRLTKKGRHANDTRLTVDLFRLRQAQLVDDRVSRGARIIGLRHRSPHHDEIGAGERSVGRGCHAALVSGRRARWPNARADYSEIWSALAPNSCRFVNRTD